MHPPGIQSLDELLTLCLIPPVLAEAGLDVAGLALAGWIGVELSINDTSFSNVASQADEDGRTGILNDE